MVLKRIRLWISAITFILRAAMTIRQIKDRDEFLLFLRERYLNSASQSKKSSKGNGSQGVHARPDQAKTRKNQDRSKPWADIKTVAWRQEHAGIVFDANKDSKKSNISEYMSIQKYWMNQQKLESVIMNTRSLQSTTSSWKAQEAKVNTIESRVCRICRARTMKCKFSPLKGKPLLIFYW